MIDIVLYNREPRAESREPRAESREPRAESREPRAELCPRRGAPPRPSPPSRATLLRSDTDLSAAGAGGAAAASGGTGGRAPAFARRRPGLFRAAACLVLAVAALLVLPLQAQEQNEVSPSWALTPSGLADGDKFRLIFVSSTERNASSSDIEVYNTFVQDRAAAGHVDIRDYSSQFQVVGSTFTVNARGNTGTTGTGVPIYWLNGNKVADNYADFYDGSWSNEANPKTESGTTPQAGPRIFTGSLDDGTKDTRSGAFGPLGSNLFVTLGRLNDSDVGDGPVSSSSSRLHGGTGEFYGLSPVFTVKSPGINDVSVTSRPADGTDTFKGGERVEITFTFSEAVEVRNKGADGANVYINVSVGNAGIFNQSANFSRQDHPRKLVFGFTVTVSHVDGNGFCIGSSCAADNIKLLNTGAIVATVDEAAASRNFGGKQTIWKLAGGTEGPTGGVCGRQSAVRDAIVAKISAADTCNEVTSTQVHGIRSLNLSNKGIGALRKQDFQYFSSMRTLDLSDNALDHLPVDLFEHATNLLETLDLEGNPLGALSASVFDGLDQLEKLILADTGLAELPAGLLADLDSLERLNLQGNRFRAIPAAALADVEGTLEDLFLRRNAIASISTGALDGLTRLRRLELQDNALTSLPAGLFDRLTELRQLKLSDNALGSLPDNLLKPLTKVETVTLGGNPGFDGFAPAIKAIPAQSVERGQRVDLEAVPGTSPWGDNVT